MIGVGLCFGSLGVSSASAVSFKFKESFGSAADPSFVRPTALAVEQADGDLLVVDVEAKTISRFNSDGTPDNFSALGTNVIDGKVGADKTPQEGLNFGANPRGVQIAADDSGGATEGNIYVTQRNEKLIDIFDEDGTYLGQLTEFNEGLLAEGATKKFERTDGVAVDLAGAVYVGDLDNGQIHKYVPAGSFPVNGDNVANFPRTEAATMAAGAAASAGSIFSIRSGSELSKFDSTTGAAKYVVDAGENITVAVNPVASHLYTTSEMVVKAYNVSGETEAELLGSFSPGSGIRGIAVDGSTGWIYVAREGQTKLEVWEPVVTPEAVTKPATNVTDSSATLNGEVNSNGAPLTACFFEWGTTTAYGNIADCEDPDFEEVGEGNSPIPVHADIEDLEAGTTYHFRLIAENAQGPDEGEDEEFQPPGPTLREQTVSGVTASGAKISASLNPQGEETGFFVEYLDEEAYLANPPAERFLGATQTPEQEVPAEVTGTGNLKEGSPIVSLLNTTAGTFGPGQEIEGPGIPSSTTVLEVLSPTELKLSKAATEEIAVAPLTATGPQPIAQQLSGLDPQTTYRFRIIASNPSGTATGPDMAFTTFALPGTAPLPEGRKYEMVSPSQKTGEAIPPEPDGGLGGSCTECLPGINVGTLPMQAAPDGESVLYEGQPFSGGLAAGPNEYVSTRGSNEWATRSLNTPIMNGRYEAFSSDFSLGVFFQRDPALSPEAPVRGGEAFPNLYLRDEADTFKPLVTVEPPERTPFEFRATYAGSNAGSAFTPEFSHLIFEANDALTPNAPDVEAGNCTFASSDCNLYEWIGGELRLVNLLPDESAAGNAVFGSGRLLDSNPTFEAPNVDHAISSDGGKIFWSSEETGDVYARVDGTETVEVPGPGSCKASVALDDRACFLTASADGTKVLLANGELFELDEGSDEYQPSADLTEGQGGFEGILGASEDLSRVYFVDTAALTGAEENANGEEAEAGKLNLYAWDQGNTSFIGALLGADGAFGLQSRYGTWKAAKPDRTAQVSPDGDFLAFMSRASLTGYDNTPSGGSCGAACLEVFVYEVDSNILRCASCNPSGARPLGQSNLSLLRPGRAGALGFPPYPQPGNLVAEGEGRVFFESLDTLLPQDTNGKVQDIYEWVPDGVGGCEQARGCVHLISSGNAPNDSMFLDSTPSGNDVFFITRERLVPRDRDDQLDLYDARVDGGFKETEKEICDPQSCKGPVSSPPAPPNTASGAFVGPGNPPAKPTCRKGFVKKKGKCVKKPKRKGKGKKGQERKRGGAR